MPNVHDVACGRGQHVVSARANLSALHCKSFGLSCVNNTSQHIRHLRPSMNHLFHCLWFCKDFECVYVCFILSVMSCFDSRMCIGVSSRKFSFDKACTVFSRMRSKGSRFTLRVWGLRVCSLDVAFTVATVRNRSQPSATVRAIPVWPCLW